jgi:hypothetical protein
VQTPRRVPIARLAAAQRAAHPGQPRKRSEHEEKQRRNADALEYPFLLLEGNVFVDFKRAGFFHPGTGTANTFRWASFEQ